MSGKAIFIALGVLGVLVLWLVFQNGDPVSTSIEDEDLTLGAEQFEGIVRGRINRGDIKRFTVTMDGTTADVTRKGDGWVMSSSFGYPADSEKIDRFFEEIEKMEGFRKSGFTRKSHRAFEVDDKTGVRVTFYGEGDKVLASAVFGGRPQKNTLESYCFVRFADEAIVYESKGGPRANVGGSGKELEKDYLLYNKLFEIPEDHEVVTAEIIRPDHNVILERRWEVKPGAEEKKPEDAADEGGAIAVDDGGAGEDAKEEEPEKEEAFFVASGSTSFRAGDKKWTVRSYLNKKDLRVDEAVDPASDLAALGLDAPQLKVVLKHRAKDDEAAPLESVTVLFGNAIKDEPKEGEDAAEQAAEDKAYYAMLEGSGKIFTVEKWTFTNWAKDLADFKDDPKDAEAGTAAPPAVAPSGESTTEPPPGEATTAAPQPTTVGGADAAPPSEAPAATPSTAPAPESVRASHILIPYKGALRAPPETMRTKEEARAEAQRLLGELTADGSKFAELAKGHSSCPSAPQGGDLGTFGRGTMTKAFEEAAFKLPVGGISGVVETEFGFHLITRTE